MHILMGRFSMVMYQMLMIISIGLCCFNLFILMMGMVGMVVAVFHIY
jgi:hypothetical protein